MKDYQKPEIKEVPFPVLSCSVGNGWMSLVVKCLFDLAKLNLSPDFSILQIKEKWGGLRIYTSYVTEEIEDVIQKYEILAEDTCEGCGAPGQLERVGGWWSVYCEKCLADTLQKYKSVWLKEENSSCIGE